MLLRMANSEFAKRIRAFRDAAKFSQSEAAEAWGMSVRTLQEWEHGRSVPSAFLAKCVLFYLRFRKRAGKK
jgi:DNA-binding transcriptional regulator YiaG